MDCKPDEQIYVGLGGNAGGEEAVVRRLARAVRGIAALPYAGRVVASSLYRTAPRGPVASQPPFLNAAVAVAVAAPVDPVRVLADLLRLEADLGRARDREVPQGPRPIDLDLLLASDRVVASPGPPAAHIPHPRLGERAFALAPVAEIGGADLPIPGLGATVGERLAAPDVAAQPIEKLADPSWTDR